jgi:hypothetical protein
MEPGVPCAFDNIYPSNSKGFSTAKQQFSTDFQIGLLVVHKLTSLRDFCRITLRNINCVWKTSRMSGIFGVRDGNNNATGRVVAGGFGGDRTLSFARQLRHLVQKHLLAETRPGNCDNWRA